MNAAEQVDRMLADGWRPSMETRAWVRGGAVVVIPGEERIEDSADAEHAAMSREQEQVLIERVWSESDPQVPNVEIREGEVDDGVS